MATMKDLDQIALALPQVTKEVTEDDRPSYLVHGKWFCFHRRPRADAVDPETGAPFSSRQLTQCLRAGAERFGWAARDPRPGRRREGRWLVGTGVAAATYPARTRPASARARMLRDGRYRVDINATDIGTGARTALSLVAADALGVDPDRVEGA